MRGGSLQALKAILGHADVKITLKYAHLSPEHLRGEISKTERPIARAAQPASEITQEITHGSAVEVELLQK
jgi:hypothetical protein